MQVHEAEAVIQLWVLLPLVHIVCTRNLYSIVCHDDNMVASEEERR